MRHEVRLVVLLATVVFILLSSCSSPSDDSELVSGIADEAWKPARCLDQAPGVDSVMAAVTRVDNDAIELVYRVPEVQCVALDAHGEKVQGSEESLISSECGTCCRLLCAVDCFRTAVATRFLRC